METSRSQRDGMTDQKESRETAEWRLRCTLPRMRSDPLIPSSAAIVLVGSVMTFSTGWVLFAFRAGDLLIAVTVVVLLLLTFVLSFRRWRGDHSLMTMFEGRLVVQRFEVGRIAGRWEAEFATIDRIELVGGLIRIRDNLGRTLCLRLDRLHLEDMFELLTDRVVSANPDCEVVP